MKPNIDNSFVHYKQALALKELGFDEHCIGLFRDGNLRYPVTTNDFEGIRNSNRFPLDDITAPLKNQVFLFFREKYNVFGYIHSAPCLIEGKSDYSFSIDTINELASSSHPNHFSCSYILEHHEHPHNKYHCSTYVTYEKAEAACIDKLIELVKHAK